MRTPRFLLGAALLFWGWQTDFLAAGALMAVILEAARWTKARWEFSDDDFSRIWTICTLLFLGVTIYAFTDNGGPARFGHFLSNPSYAAQTSAATTRTASAMLRWLPMVLFFFVMAQAYSTREEIPISTISLILRRRWKKAAKSGKPVLGQRGMNVSYPYFAICLFAASVHPGKDNSFFWGFCALLCWALWTQRTRRFSVLIWAGVLAAAFTSGYLGQHAFGQLQSYIQTLDPQWFERFARRGGTDPEQSRTQIGRIGRIKLSGRIAIRVLPESDSIPPQYLREASYRIYNDNRGYRGTSWNAGTSRDGFESLQPETNNAAYVLVQKTNLSRANITCYLENFSRESGVPVGLLPLPSGSGRLENLPAFVLRMNTLGAVLAEGPGLVSFNAAYGPGPTMDSPFNPNESNSFTNYLSFGWNHYNRREGRSNVVVNANPDLFIPAREEATLKEVVSQWNIPRGNRPLAMRTIANFFESNFTYSTWQEMPRIRRRGTNQNPQTPIGLFLTRTRHGHCEYFATATVLLLRELGVPARYAVGYAVHEKSGQEYVVRLRDAHSWALVWNEHSRSWQDFDTTPSTWIDEEALNASPFQKLSDLWSWFGFQFAKFRWGQSNLRQYMIIGLVPVFGLLAYQIFFRQKRKRKNRSSTAAASLIWPGLDSEFYLIEKKLNDLGLARWPNETISAWLKRALADPQVESAAEPMRDILRLHYQYRFDPQGLTESDRGKLRHAAEVCLKQIKARPV